MRNRTLNTCLAVFLFSLLAAAQTKTQNETQTAVAPNNQGVKQMSLGKYEAAIELFNRAIRLQPNYATAYYNLGAAFFHLQLFEKAAAFGQAIKVYPEYAEAFNNLGTVYSEAIAEIRRAVDINPNDVQTQFLLGNIYI